MSESEAKTSQMKAERDRLADRLSASSNGQGQSQQTPEQKALMAKLSFAQAWGIALQMYADEHDGDLPANLKEPTPYIDPKQWQSKANAFGFQTDQFELAYHGSLKRLQDPAQIILVKETQPTHLHDGRWAKVYLFCDGRAELKTNPDENFGDWEKEHSPSEVVSPASR